MVLESGELRRNRHLVEALLTSSIETTAYFQRLAHEIDLDSFSNPNELDGASVEGRISRPEREPLKPVFDPMRRKLSVAT